MINPAVLNIGGNRVGYIDENDKPSGGNRTCNIFGSEKISGGNGSPQYIRDSEGRYPAQSFVDDDTALILDKQSGIKEGSGKIRKGSIRNHGKGSVYTLNGKMNANDDYGDTGGCSKILQKIKKDDDTDERATD